MKSILILVTAITLFASCEITDKKNNSSEITSSDINSENPPVFEWEKSEHNFGTIAIGESIEYVYKFKNTGEGPLVIHSVKPSCGCTALKGWPKNAIQPGETGEIPIEFTPNIAGTMTKSISIVANTNPSQTILYLKGEVAGVE